MKSLKQSKLEEQELHKEVSWLIFKTDISKNQIHSLNLVLNTHCGILKWTIDLDDCDRVFRVIPTRRFNETQVLQLMQNHGFEIEPLMD